MGELQLLKHAFKDVLDEVILYLVSWQLGCRIIYIGEVSSRKVLWEFGLKFEFFNIYIFLELKNESNDF